jgi:hypothetical protein
MGILSFWQRRHSHPSAIARREFHRSTGPPHLASTLPQSFPVSSFKKSERASFRHFGFAESAQLPYQKLSREDAALKLTARELRGGAIVFLMPRGLTTK